MNPIDRRCAVCPNGFHCSRFKSAGAVNRDLKRYADLTHPGAGKPAKATDQDCD